MKARVYKSQCNEEGGAEVDKEAGEEEEQQYDDDDDNDDDDGEGGEARAIRRGARTRKLMKRE